MEKGVDLLKNFPEAKTPPNLHFNPYFANLNIAMPPPLTTNGQVTMDGTPGDRRPDGQGRSRIPRVDGPAGSREPPCRGPVDHPVPADCDDPGLSGLSADLAPGEASGSGYRRARPANQAKSRKAKAKQNVAG